MRFVKKDVKPSLGAYDAFMAQRGQDGQSVRLRTEVARLLSQGKAHTTTVAKVFELICKDSADRVTDEDVARVLPGFASVDEPKYFW